MIFFVSIIVVLNQEMPFFLEISSSFLLLSFAVQLCFYDLPHGKRIFRRIFHGIIGHAKKL